MKYARLIIIISVILWSIFALFNGSSTNLKFGLDLIGGAQLKFVGIPTAQITKITPEIMQGTVKVIENRVNASGTTEAVVQQIGKDRLAVEIPGQNPEMIKRRLLRTAKLDFRELSNVNGLTDYHQANLPWVITSVSGADLKRAQAMPDPTGSGQWLLAFEMKDAGARKFSNLTGRLLKGILPSGLQAYTPELDMNGKATGNMIAKTNLPLAIFLDDQMISSASVQGQISTNGQISGNFTQEQAVDLALQLNAGALPIPLELIEERTISPTLGKESLHKSFFAGLVGLILIAIYMLIVYRLPGLLSIISLGIYVLISLAVFTKTVVLSAAGIAGFILSIGMAVDANILIFERLKEELRAGKPLYKAIEEGFARAFPSIFDSNLNTLIVCLILGILGTGLVKGFAITLALGVLLSFFTAIFITRSLMNFILGFDFFRKNSFYIQDTK